MFRASFIRWTRPSEGRLFFPREDQMLPSVENKQTSTFPHQLSLRASCVFYLAGADQEFCRFLRQSPRTGRRGKFPRKLGGRRRSGGPRSHSVCDGEVGSSGRDTSDGSG